MPGRDGEAFSRTANGMGYRQVSLALRNEQGHGNAPIKALQQSAPGASRPSRQAVYGRVMLTSGLRSTSRPCATNT